MKKLLGGFASLALMLGAVAVVHAMPADLFGEASVVPGGNPGNAAQLVSDANPGYGGVDFDLAGSPIAWNDLDTLSTDYNVTDDDCGAGSPRFQLNVDTNNDGVSDGNVFVAIGPSPNFTDCPTGWQSTGNLIGNEDSGRYDFGQFGGSASTTYSNAPSSVMNGKVVGIQLVVDSGWNSGASNGDGEQTILVDNININGDIHTFDPVVVGPPTNKDQCKNDGWKTFNNPTFKNQGQCVSSVTSNRGGNR